VIGRKVETDTNEPVRQSLQAQYAFEKLTNHVECISRYITYFATFFIVNRTETSITNSYIIISVKVLRRDELNLTGIPSLMNTLTKKTRLLMTKIKGTPKIPSKSQRRYGTNLFL